MPERLTTYSIFRNEQTFYLLLIFIGAHVLSFFIHPYPIFQAFIVFTLVFILGLVFFKNPIHAWMIILGELLLGGSGHLFEFYGLSIRTILVLTFLFLWIVYSLSSNDETHSVRIPHKLYYALFPLYFFVVVSAINALLQGNSIVSIIQDAIPFLYFLLFLPASYLFKSENIRHYFVRLIIVFVIGSALFSLFLFVAFISGASELHGPLYNWFRDTIMGKITFVTEYFYRIVTPAHLLIVPLMLFIDSLLMRDEKHNRMWRILFVACSIILLLNFSRALLLGYIVGILFLKYKHKLRRFIIVSAWSLLVIVLLFISINIVSSMGRSIGLEIVGIRIGSFLQPKIETSTNIRMALLSPIWQQITEHPMLGSGLGSQITYVHPITYTHITTRQYDWGYLEMWAELGVFGSLSLLTLIGLIIIELITKIRSITDYHDAYVGLLAGVVALLIINITTPALYHVLGISYLAFVMAFVSKPITIFDDVVTMLYRIFNKIRSEQP